MAREWMYGTLDRTDIAKTLGPGSAFARNAEASSARALAKRLERVGRRAVDIAESHISADFDNGRPPERRRDPGTRHLQGSIRFRIDWNGTGFPVTINLYSEANPDKVAALEFGAEPHGIDGSPLAFPRSGAANRGARRVSDVRGPSFGRRESMVVTNHVDHPGNKPFRFMRRALNEAVRELL